MQLRVIFKPSSSAQIDHGIAVASFEHSYPEFSAKLKIKKLRTEILISSTPSNLARNGRAYVSFSSKNLGREYEYRKNNLKCNG